MTPGWLAGGTCVTLDGPHLLENLITLRITPGCGGTLDGPHLLEPGDG